MLFRSRPRSIRSFASIAVGSLLERLSEWMLLCRETEWSNEGYSVVAGVPTGTFPEPEVWARLLEAYLRALKKAENYEGHEFTSVKTAPRGPLPKAEIRAVLEKVFE